MRAVPIIGCVLGLGLEQPPAIVGSQLATGTRLHYASTTDTMPQLPWVVESVHRDTTIGGRPRSTVVVLRMRPQPAAADTRSYHVAGDTLLVFDVATARWLPSRPVGPRMTLALPRAGGGQVQYTTGDTGRTVVSGVSLPTVHTTVTTLDPSGRAVRRLTERYALAITSAVEGTFEVADSTATGGWRVVQRFTLRHLEHAR